MATHDTIALSTFTLERTLKASPARVFRAWAEPEQRAVWAAPEEGITLRIDAADFSVGGQDKTVCVAGGEDAYFVNGRYYDIVPDARIVMTETIATPEGRLGVSLVSAEFIASGEGCTLVLTVQTSALDGSGLEDGVNEGWTASLDTLAAMLAEEGGA